MKLYWTETARQDLLSIKRYIASDNPTAAKQWVDRLRARARGALHAPLAGRKVPELSRDDIRELIEGNSFPHANRIRSEQNGESGAKQRMKGWKMGKIG